MHSYCRKAVVLTTLLLIAAAGQAQTVKIKGSTGLLPVEEFWSRVYAKVKPGVKVIALGGGETVGINSLHDGSTDCASVGRSVTDAELKKLNGPLQATIAYDALLFIVHPQNPVKSLTFQQLEDIYSGKVKNWVEVGGANLPIHPMAPDANYGTHQIVREKIMDGKGFGPTVKVAASEHELLASVWTDPSAISFSGIALGKDFPHVTISREKGSAPYSPNAENLRAGRYPLIFPVQLVCGSNASAATKEFVAWTGTAAGQQAVEGAGLIPAKFGKR